jgi:hypothetical protein
MKLTSSDLTALGYIECPACHRFHRGACPCGGSPASVVAIKTPPPASMEGGGIKTPKKAPAQKMTKAESEFLRHLEAGIYGEFVHIFTYAVRLPFGDGTSYRPDMMTIDVDGRICCWEVKGGYKGPGWEQGYERFRAARRHWPKIKFVMAEKTKQGWVMR